jgi:hypothetical protein
MGWIMSMHKFLIVLLAFALIIAGLPYLPSYILSSPYFPAFIMFFMGSFLLAVFKA